MLIPMPMPVGTPDLQARVQQLENALTLTLGLLKTLLGRLDLKLGEGFLGQELEQLVFPNGVQVREEVERINTLLQQGQKPPAARLVRELTGATWDQAHAVLECWGSYSF